MVVDQLPNVGGDNGIIRESLPVLVVNPDGTVTNNSQTLDGFGRSRASLPFTMFDSQQRYTQRDDQFATETVGSASTTYNINESTLDLSVSASGDRATRETRRIFSYQPGKSLQILATFAMSAGQSGLTQRVGYFNDDNGIYFANIDGVNYLVKRSKVSGTVIETRVAQDSWNVDTIDGNGASGLTLDPTKAQILFIDIEWLGVGMVRTGFVIDGRFITAHHFKHANIESTTYMTTACLPLRYEIESGAAISATLKQICSTVISEGGYSLSGQHRAVSPGIANPYTLTNKETYYPVLSIRLRSTRLDSIAILNGANLLGIDNNIQVGYRLIRGATLTGGAWNPADSASAVEYNTTAASLTGGEIIEEGFFGVTNQNAAPISLSATSPFSYQLERDGLAGTADIITLAVASSADATEILASLGWIEVL